MAKVVFFRNARQDGGVRTGIEIDGQAVWHQFSTGKGEVDPTLEWWVDVRCEGKNVPTDPDAAREWLMDESNHIADFVAQASKDIDPQGFDVGLNPFRREYKQPGVRVAVLASAARRITSKKMGRVLTEIAKKWNDYLNELQHPSAV